MNWGVIWPVTLAITVVVQLVIWWVNREKLMRKPWIRRLLKSRPMRDSERRWLERYEQQRRDLARPGIAGKAVAGSKPGPSDTRVGGPLIVRKGAPPPSNAFGEPLLPLLVIRLSDLPDMRGNVLPKDGWIQILVDGKMEWVDQPIPQGALFRIMHFEDGTEFDVYPVDHNTATEHPAWRNLKQHAGLLTSGYSLDFEQVVDIAYNSDYRIDSLPDGMTSKAFDDAFDTTCYAMDDQMPYCDVMIGGNANFTQEDVRYDKKFAGFENLIRLSASGLVFSWGDAGEAMVMTPAENLSNGDMENAVFYFDTH